MNSNTPTNLYIVNKFLTIGENVGKCRSRTLTTKIRLEGLTLKNSGLSAGENWMLCARDLQTATFRRVSCKMHDSTAFIVQNARFRTGGLAARFRGGVAVWLPTYLPPRDRRSWRVLRGRRGIPNRHRRQPAPLRRSQQPLRYPTTRRTLSNWRISLSPQRLAPGWCMEDRWKLSILRY